MDLRHTMSQKCQRKKGVITSKSERGESAVSWKFAARRRDLVRSAEDVIATEDALSAQSTLRASDSCTRLLSFLPHQSIGVFNIRGIHIIAPQKTPGNRVDVRTPQISIDQLKCRNTATHKDWTPSRSNIATHFAQKLPAASIAWHAGDLCQYLRAPPPQLHCKH